LNGGFVEMLSASSAEKAEFVVVGAQAMAAHVPVSSMEDSIASKRATGRPKDMAEVVWLESGKRS
jgi:hypothetical protein